MARFGFVGPSYRSQSVNADCQVCLNWYVETIESGQGKGSLALYRTPGLNLQYNLGTSPIRGMITAQGRTFAVSGTTLWELLPAPIFPVAVTSIVFGFGRYQMNLPASASFSVGQQYSYSGGNALATGNFQIAQVIGPSQYVVTPLSGQTFAGSIGGQIIPANGVLNAVVRGTIVSDGQPVSMASGPTQVLIASGGNLYCYQLVASTVSQGVAGTFAANSLTLLSQYNNTNGIGLLGNVSQVAYGDGFFFALIANSNQIQASNPLDGSTWQGVSETQVSVFSDNVSAIYVDHRLLAVFGPNATQAYYDSGNFPFPYDVIEGGFIEQGIAAPFSVAKLDNSVFWLGQDSRGNGIVWRANGYQPVRVSTHAIEYALSTYKTIADAICYAYQDQGHTFYVMNFPTAQKTWVYDCATQMWHQRGFWNAQSGTFTQSRAAYHTFNFGMHLVGDPTTGAVYQQSIQFLSDFGNVIRRVRRAPHISAEQSYIFHLKLQVDVETGVGPVPPFTGVAQPVTFLLADLNGVNYLLGIGENGVIQAPQQVGSTAVPSTVFLNDLLGQSSWQITVTTNGQIQPVEVPFNAAYPQAILFVTSQGDQRWNLQIEDVGGGIGVLQANSLGFVGRGPLMMLRWSEDGGHTWSNIHERDCGQAGAYKTRVLWNKLGRSRDRVYEVSVTDPVPWAIVDAYLFTDPADREPKERYASMLRKQA